MDDKDETDKLLEEKDPSLIDRAKEATKENKPAEALKLYEEEIQNLIQEIKEKSLTNDRRNRLKRQCSEYLSMAEVLKMELGVEAQPKHSVEDNEELEHLLDVVTNVDPPDFSLDDVCGCQEAIDQLKESVILPCKFPQLVKGQKRPWKGVLLYGAVGTGKTMIGRALAKEDIDATFIKISAVDLISKYVDSERLIDILFKRVNANSKPCILFIDDFEQFFDEDDECSQRFRRLRTTFLYHVVHMIDNVYMIVGTHQPWKIKESFLRRLDRRIYVPLPNKEARKQIIKNNLKSSKHQVKDDDINLLADKTDGYTGADIVMAIRDALMEPLRKIQSATHFKKVEGPSPTDPDVLVNDLLTPCASTDSMAIQMSWKDITDDKLNEPVLMMDDILKGLDRTPPSINKEELQQYEEFSCNAEKTIDTE